MAILLLPWRPWSTSQKLEAIDGPKVDLTDLTALIPTRNEAETIEAIITGLKAQGPGLHILIVDDRSADNTVKVAKRCANQNVTVIKGKPLPEGWSGKLWALTMPAIGTLYLSITWTSAVWTWRGEGTKWKGRSYFTGDKSR